MPGIPLPSLVRGDCGPRFQLCPSPDPVSTACPAIPLPATAHRPSRAPLLNAWSVDSGLERRVVPVAELRGSSKAESPDAEGPLARLGAYSGALSGERKLTPYLTPYPADTGGFRRTSHPACSSSSNTKRSPAALHGQFTGKPALPDQSQSRRRSLGSAGPPRWLRRWI